MKTKISTFCIQQLSGCIENVFALVPKQFLFCSVEVQLSDNFWEEVGYAAEGQSVLKCI
jgi:hypothetical protein